MQISVYSIFNLIPGAFFALFGIGLIALRKTVSRAAANWNNKLWHFSATEKEYQIAFLVGGVIFVVIGILACFGILQFRK